MTFQSFVQSCYRLFHTKCHSVVGHPLSLKFQTVRIIRIVFGVRSLFVVTLEQESGMTLEKSRKWVGCVLFAATMSICCEVSLMNEVFVNAEV